MECWHMSGAGNDFMVVDGRGQALRYAAMAVALCKKTGADGFMAVDTSDKGDFRLHFYNSDGSRGEMCGNGSRCVCRFAYEKGIAPETMSVETDAGIVYGWRLGEEQYRVQLNNPGVLDLHRKGDIGYVELGCPGVPHGIVEVPGFTWADKERLKPRAEALRHDPAFPKGANINLYTFLDDTTVRVLTFERGVEDYTLACGTGCGSVASVLWTKGLLPGGVLRAENQGGTLQVTVEGTGGKVSRLLLEGPARVLKVYQI